MIRLNLIRPRWFGGYRRWDFALLQNAVLCPRCNRMTTGWLLKRADICAPAAWSFCIRDPRRIAEREAEKC